MLCVLLIEQVIFSSNRISCASSKFAIFWRQPKFISYFSEYWTNTYFSVTSIPPHLKAIPLVHSSGNKSILPRSNTPLLSKSPRQRPEMLSTTFNYFIILEHQGLLTLVSLYFAVAPTWLCHSDIRAEKCKINNCQT